MSNNKTNQTGKNAPGKDDGLNAFAKGKLTPHKLSKKAAKVAQDLRDGELAPEDVSRMMREALEKEAMEQLTQAFGKMQGLNKDMYVNRIDSVQVMLGGDLLLSDLSRSACGDNEDLRHRFARSFFANKVWKDSVRQQIVLNDEGVCEKVRDMKLLLQVQKDFDATCKIFQPYIEGHFHKPLKSFCDCYQVDFTTFVGRCVELINKWERFSIENLARDLAYTRSLQTEQQVQAAARGVQAGFDTVRLLCWECGREQAKILKCSVCKAARYCSPACQLKSWKGGHKAACTNLKAMYKRFTANRDRIDLAIKQNRFSEDCAFPPAGARDFALLPMMLSKETFPSNPNPTCGASMDILYSNLCDIFHGESRWILPDTFTEHIPSYVTMASHLLKNRVGDFWSDDDISKVTESVKLEVPVNLDVVRDALKRIEDWESNYMTHALMLLAADASNLDPIDSIYWISNCVDFLKGLTPTGELLPATRFVGIYFRYGAAFYQGYEDPSRRAEYITKALKAMMICFHKQTLLDPDLWQQAMAEVDDKLKR